VERGQLSSFLHQPVSAQDSALGFELQERLMAPVQAPNRRLGNPAGELVDALDDPADSVTAHGNLQSDVARAVRKIRTVCR
jgi:hypothetical protein